MICPICNKELKIITNSHLKTHNLSVKDFKSLYPNINVGREGTKTSKQASMNMSNAKKKYYENGGEPWNKGMHDVYSEETIKLMSENRKGYKAWNEGQQMSNETKTKLSESLKEGYANGRKVWNDGLTKEEDERLKSIGRKNSENLKGTKQSKDTIQKRIQSRRKNNKFWYKNPEKTRNKISNSLKMGYANGSIILSKRAGKGIKTMYKNILFRSSWEAKVAEWLDKNGYIWKYEVQRYKIIDESYLPDFFIYDENDNLIKIIEVKGYVTEKCILLIEKLKKILHIEIILFDNNKLKELGIL